MMKASFTDVSRLDSLDLLHDVRIQALRPKVIVSGFKKAGIEPFDSEVVLTKVSLVNNPFIADACPRPHLSAHLLQ